MVATKGVEDVAGSIPKLFNMNGSIEPSSVPQRTIPTSEKPTVNPISTKYLSNAEINCERNKTWKKPIVPSISPSDNPESTYRFIIFHQSIRSTSPNAIARITSVDAWEPEFPPLEIISGINIERTIALLNSSSK